MAAKKSKAGLAGVRSEIRTLSEAVWALRDQVRFEAAAASANGHSQPTPAPTVVTGDLADSEGRGVVISRGLIRSHTGASELLWETSIAVESLLAADTDEPARLLAAIGHPQRLAIVKLLLDGSTTAATLVTNLELGTTGAAYHHLNVLQGAGLVTQAARGVFDLVPDRAGSILAILAALEATSIEVDTEDPEVPAKDSKPRRKKSS